MQLTSRQLEKFFSVGYVVRRDVFAPSEVHELRRAFERLERAAYRLRETCMHRGSLFVLSPIADDRVPVSIQRIVWCGAAEPKLSEFGSDPRLLSMASQILGSKRMNQLINQAHFKIPGDGVEFPWHQDSTHRRYGHGCWNDANGRGSYVQTVIAVDHVTEDNGPLQLIPGSCKLGHLGLPEGQLPTDRLDPRAAVSATMRAGSVLLFGPYTFHRSTPNRSHRPRRIFLNGFAYPGANTRTYPGEGAGRVVYGS
jgi:ectoine hydroxylase-related dioxygenase (phytanoyl-CoA dioxygenase family)